MAVLIFKLNGKSNKLYNHSDSVHMKTNEFDIGPLVSVCVPTYNRAKKLERAIKSLISGSYKNLEIIISDNASTDETQSVCSALRESDRRVKYFRHAENHGPTANFEFARSKAVGKYFLWHGDDDYLDSDYIRICVDELEQDHSIILVSGVAVYRNGDNRTTHLGNVIQLNSEFPLLRIIKYLWLVGENSIFCGAYRMDRVKECGMPNCLAGDWAWMAEVLYSGKAKVVPLVHVHREFEDSTSSSKARIVSVINAPRWHGIFPSIAISGNVAGYLISRLNLVGRLALIKKVSIYLLVYGVLLIKGLMVNFRLAAAKIYFLKAIYRRFFKK